MIRCCIECGCTDLAACELPDGSACAWVSGGLDLCTACVDEEILEPALPSVSRRHDFDLDPRKDAPE